MFVGADDKKRNYCESVLFRVDYWLYGLGTESGSFDQVLTLVILICVSLSSTAVSFS